MRHLAHMQTFYLLSPQLTLMARKKGRLLFPLIRSEWRKILQILLIIKCCHLSLCHVFNTVAISTQTSCLLYFFFFSNLFLLKCLVFGNNFSLFLNLLSVFWKYKHTDFGKTGVWVGFDYWYDHRPMAVTQRRDNPWPAVCTFVGLCWYSSRHLRAIWSSRWTSCEHRSASNPCCIRCVYLELAAVLSCHNSYHWKKQPNTHHKQQGGYHTFVSFS